MAGDDDLTLMIRAAWLYHVAGLNQAETAERLGTTRARVNRLLAEAREAGHVTVVVDDRLAGALPLEDALAARFGLSFCHVTPPTGLCGEAGERAAFRAVGLAAANMLRRELARRPDLTIGVAWGRTLEEMSRHVLGVSAPRARFVALMGSLSASAAANPFEVVHNLARRTGAEGIFLPVPFVADSAADREMLLSQRLVAQAFAVARSSDIAFISVGELTETALIRQRNMISAHDLARLRAAGAVADTTGRFFAGDGTLVADEIVGRMLAVDLSQVKGRIVLLAAGRAKKEAAMAVMRSGLAAGAILDGDLAEAIAAGGAGDAGGAAGGKAQS